MLPLLRSLPRFFAPMVLTCLPFVAVACGGGGGGGAATLRASDVNGTWTITEEIVTANGTACDAVGTTSTFTITIAATDASNVVTITVQGEDPFTLNKAGNRLRGSLVDAGSFFRDTTTFDLGFASGALSGTVTLEELAIFDGTQSTLCNSTSRITGVRVGGGGGGGGASFVGNWDVSTTSISTTPTDCSDSTDAFPLTIAVNGSTATLTQFGQPPITLNVVNGRLQGTQTETIAPGFTVTVTFDIGQTNANTLSGTLVSVTQVNGVTECSETLDLTGTRL